MKDSVVAIGTFDGVHLGHQYLIEKLLQKAKKKDLRSILVVFSAPIRKIQGVLTTVDEKIGLLENYPIDQIIVLYPDKKLLAESADSFFDNYIVLFF